MKKTLVKICGITNRDDAETAVASGADALGFNFYPKSPRYTTEEKAIKICERLPDNIVKIGVFVNAGIKLLDKIASENFLSYFQFHGDESPNLCERYSGKVVKAFRINSSFDSALLEGYDTCSMFLFDTKVDGQYGGSGLTFDWKILSSLPRTHPFILAGGLNEDNVEGAIRIVKPYMVDVSSSVESSPGKKDPEKVKLFIRACQAADVHLYNS